jgi:hypothetical protein
VKRVCCGGSPAGRRISRRRVDGVSAYPFCQGERGRGGSGGLGPNVSAKIAGGVNINGREAGFALRETGAGPAGLPIIVSDRWTSIDPALDLGLQVGIGHLGDLPMSAGVDVLMDWTRSHTLFARSPNFPSQSYTMETGRQMDTMVLFNISLGLAPAPAQPRIVTK